MKLRTLFVLDAAISLLLALGFLLGPATMLKFFGLTQGKTEVLLAQVVGAALVGFAALAWFSRDAVDLHAAPGPTVALIIFGAIGFVVTLLALLSQVTRAGAAWILVILFLASAAGFAYFQFVGPRE
jgi:hypothetical protein